MAILIFSFVVPPGLPLRWYVSSTRAGSSHTEPAGRLHVLAAALIAVLLGCSNETPTQRGSLTATAHLRIGSVDSAPYLLTSIGAVSVGSNRSIYVLQAREQTVRVFDSSGTFIKTFGRAGQGPGEFTAPTAMGWIGDTLWIRDAATRRVSYFTPDGTFLRWDAREPTPPGPEYTRHTLTAPLIDGGAVVSFGWSSSSSRPSHSFVARGNAEGRVVDTLAREPIHRTFVEMKGGGTSPQPFSDAALVGVARRGQEVIVARRSAASDQQEAVTDVDRIDIKTGRHWTTRYAFIPVPLTRETIDSVIDRQVETVFRTEMGRIAWGTPDEARQHLRTHVYVPPVLPAASRLIAGDDGTVWLEHWRSNTWLVIAPNGQALGDVEVPDTVRPLTAVQGYMWGVDLDLDGVPFLVTYRIEARPGVP